MNQVIRLVSAAAFLLAIILVSLGAVKDGDLWWQMEYGRQLLESGTLITDHSLYSWTPSSNTLIYCAWIAQIVLHLVFETSGLIGLNVLRVFILVLPASLVWLLYRQQKMQIPAYMMGILFVATFTAMHSAGLLKPELFGFMFFTLLIFSYFAAKNKKTARLPIIAIPILILFWVNSHGTFAVGIFFLAIVLIGELINRKFKPELSFDSGQWRLIYAVAPLIILATMVTPYGISYPLQLISWYAGSSEDLSYTHVLAYNSIFSDTFKHLGAIYFFVILVAIYLSLAWETVKLKRFDFSILLINIVFLCFSSGWARASYFSPVVLLMSISFLAIHSPFCKNISSNIKLSNVLAAVSTLAILLFSTSWFYFSRTADPDGPLIGVGYYNPQDAARHVQNNYLNAKICNGYDGGGYLVWLFKDTQRVMIDPRYFPYKNWYPDWLGFEKAPDRKKLANYNCDLWILNHHYGPINNLLIKHPNWVLSYIGPAAAVYVKTNLVNPNTELQISPKVDSLRSLRRTALILNSMLSIGNFDTAEKIASNARKFWIGTANEMPSLRALEFVQGTKHYFFKEDLLAYSLLRNAHGGETVIWNERRLQSAGQYAVTTLWKEGRVVLAQSIAIHLLELNPDNRINLYNVALLTLLIENRDSFDWRKALNQFITKPRSGIPHQYYEHAEQMLSTSEPSKAPPLIPTDKRVFQN
jgi:hypothetical protein